MKPRLLTLSLIALLCLATRQKAYGHAFPDHAEPRVGSVVSSAPAVRIWFDGALEPLFCTITVTDASGRKADRGDGRVNASDPVLLEVNLPQLSPGVYRVVWKVVSRDGHRTEGEYTFTLR